MKRTNAAQNGYLPSNWETGDPVENREKADFANKYWGVTPAQEQAMLCGSMFGWMILKKMRDLKRNDLRTIQKSYCRGKTPAVTFYADLCSVKPRLSEH